MNENEKQTYEVDQAMLGHLFCGDFDDLVNFCNIFEAELGVDHREYIKIVPVEAFNGARSLSDVFFPVTAWNKALDKHAKTYPGAWAV